MTRPLFFIATAILFIACQPSNYREKKSKEAVAVVAEKTSNLPYPDTLAMKHVLMDYFERHKGEEQFDTFDYDVYDYCRASPSEVTAGHLFSDKEVHAMIYLTTELTSTLLVYRKVNEDWVQIYGDTSSASWFIGPEFVDWNSDGVNDISLLHLNPTSSRRIYDLWLLDKNMNAVHEVPEFGRMYDTELDSVSGIITEVDDYRNRTVTAKYKFKNYKLVKLSSKTVTNY